MLFALTQPISGLRDAFVLPLRWRPDTPDSPFLPAALRDLAVLVRAELGVEGHGLELDGDAGLARTDLSDWPLEARSGFAALAAGLATARHEGRQDPQVLATAWWERGRGFRPVAGKTLVAKIEAAVAFGARRLFVAESDAEPARRAGGAGLRIGILPEGVPDPWAACEDFFDACGAPPGPTASLDLRVRYHDEILRNRSDRQESYYETHLLADVAKPRHRGAIKDWPEGRPWPSKGLVTMLSLQPKVAISTLLQARPQRLLVLHTAESACKLGTLERWLDRLRQYGPVDLELARLDDHNDVTATMEIVSSRLSAWGFRADRIAADVCSGPTPVSLALLLACPPGTALLYHDHHYNPATRSAVPGSERLRFLLRRPGEDQLPRNR
ncbi:hypothetical protein ACFL59_13220 [Planctomycetota bacterium]